jgi:hypothetical protein
VRLLVSGMGDALSTYFEARANKVSGCQTMAGGASTLAAQAIAELCYKTLLADGYKAKLAVEQGLYQGGGEHHRGQHLSERYRLREQRSGRRPPFTTA